MGNDISGLADPNYRRPRPSTTPPSSSRTSDSPPGWPIPSRSTTMSWPTWPASSPNVPRRAAAGLAPDKIVLDAGLDLGKTAEQR